MFKKTLSALLFLYAFLSFFVAVKAQASLKVTNSEITSATLPNGAERLLSAKVPAEFNQLFDEFLNQGAGKITGGDREVLAWLGNYKSPSSVSKMATQIQANFRNAGWEYESEGKNGDIDIFSLKKDSPRRVVVGYLVPGNEVIVCALMEIKDAGEKIAGEAKNDLPVMNNGKSDLSIYGKWFRTVGGSSIDYTGKTRLKGGEDFTFQFFTDGTVEYTRKKEVINWMQCHITESQNARGKFTLSGNTLTINLGAMKSVSSNSCDAKGNFNKMLGNSTMTAQIQIKQMDDITRPDKPMIMCFDGNEVCYERQK